MGLFPVQHWKGNISLFGKGLEIRVSILLEESLGIPSQFQNEQAASFVLSV